MHPFNWKNSTNATYLSSKLNQIIEILLGRSQLQKIVTHMILLLPSISGISRARVLEDTLSFRFLFNGNVQTGDLSWDSGLSIIENSSHVFPYVASWWYDPPSNRLCPQHQRQQSRGCAFSLTERLLLSLWERYMYGLLGRRWCRHDVLQC